MKKIILPTLFAIGLVLLGSAATSAQTSSVAGEWDAAYNTPGGPRAFKLVFAVDGEKITGTAKRSNGDVPLTGTIKGDDISFNYTISYNGNGVLLSFTGKVKGDTMGGTVFFNEAASDEWSAKRTPPPTADKPKSN
ncbi:MAG: hypothetical protein KA956_07480 [Pyrinomonadaceae bacterium]|nr:hypothetical protein [Acidobacteriota bacterium]MBP7376302.1 hypothetical protein [Pyrinomonadaceae bacterium]